MPAAGPAKPATPVKPTTPATPVKPATPAKSVSAAKPATPVTPVKPASPVKSATPAKSAVPVKPARPVQPAVPATSATSAAKKVEPEIVLADADPLLTLVGGRPRAKKAAAESQVMAPAPEESTKKKRSWLFWRRPSKRSLELAEVRKGCEKIEQVVGAIRDQLETAEKDRVVLNKTLSPLPLAVDGLKQVGETQVQTNAMLKRVGGSLERAEEKDKAFFKTMDRMGDTMSNMDMAVVGMGRTFSSMERTSKQSVDTMQRLSERLTESDRFLKETFDRLRDAEHQYGEYMRTNSRRSALVTITLCALMTLGIAVLAHTLGGASHNVTVLRPHVPASLPANSLPVETPDPAPADWQSQPTEKWMGVAGDWPVEGPVETTSPVESLSILPTSLEIPALEDLLSVNKEIAE